MLMAGVGDMLNDYQEAHFSERCREEEPEETTKVYCNMLSADSIGRVMALKSLFSLSRDIFDTTTLIVFGGMLPKGHILSKSTYESWKLLRALKMIVGPLLAICLIFV